MVVAGQSLSLQVGPRRVLRVDDGDDRKFADDRIPALTGILLFNRSPGHGNIGIWQAKFDHDLDVGMLPFVLFRPFLYQRVKKRVPVMLIVFVLLRFIFGFV